MKVLNLDPNFSPYSLQTIDFKSFAFPSNCEIHIKLKEKLLWWDDTVMITTRIKSSDDIMLLLMATDALKRSGIKNIELFIPYLPYARQDRQMIDGEPLSLKVFADILNAQEYSQVMVYDVHSEVSLALINNSKSYNNHLFVSQVLNNDEGYYIVSPDAGAYKKIFKLCRHLHYREEIIMCNKLRDVESGVIRSMTISHDDLNGKDCYIIDDICDGGATFTGLAYELRRRNAGKIYLIVSHGIFSKGMEVFENINHIYTTNTFKDLEQNNKLTQIKLQYESHLHSKSN